MPRHACACRPAHLAYSEAFDSYFCPECRAWATPACDDDTCCYCPTRPESAEGLALDDLVPAGLFEARADNLAASGHTNTLSLAN